MTEQERDGKFYQIADKGREWLNLRDAVRDVNLVYPQQASQFRQEMKLFEKVILALADEIRSADLAEAHRDACEDW